MSSKEKRILFPSKYVSFPLNKKLISDQKNVRFSGNEEIRKWCHQNNTIIQEILQMYIVTVWPHIFEVLTNMVILSW